MARNCCRQSTTSTWPAVPATPALEARIASYELAAKLQLSAPEVLDLSGETEATKRLYGLDDKITEISAAMPDRPPAAGARAFASCRSGAAPTTVPRRNWDSTKHLGRDHWRHGPAASTSPPPP